MCHEKDFGRGEQAEPKEAETVGSEVQWAPKLQNQGAFFFLPNN